MNLKELFVFFHEIESKYPVGEWRINGVCFWPILRIRLGFTYEFQALGVNNNIQKQSLYGRWYSHFCSLVKAIKGNIEYLVLDGARHQELLESDIVMSGTTANMNVLLPTGEFLDNIMDPIRDVLEKKGFKVFKLESIGKNQPRYPRWKSSYPVDLLIWWERIHNKIVCSSSKSTKIDATLYNEFQSDCKNRGVDCNLELSETVRAISGLEYLAKRYSELLQRIHPKIVLTQTWYDSTQMALTLAAHRLFIPVVDVQHGVAAGSGLHKAYSKWLNVPKQGYELMPDYFWVWSQDDYDAIRSWGGDKAIPFIGGQPINLLWCNPQNEFVKIYQRQYSQYFGSEKPTILLTLQWAMPYPQWLVDFINSDVEYVWLLRLHPVVDENERTFLSKIVMKGNIILEHIDRFPLEILLKNVDVHITMHSSVVLDAAVCGCPSIIMHSIGREKYAKYISDGSAVYADNPVDLSNAVHDILSRGNMCGGRDNHSMEAYRRGENGIRYVMSIIQKQREKQGLR